MTARAGQRGRRAPWALAAVVLACLIAAGQGAPGAATAAGARGGGSGPNFVVITTDDQSIHSFRRSVMPRTFREVVRPGTRFQRSFAAPPLCCPDRAGFLTGEYPHNNGVVANRPGYDALRQPGRVLPAWLQAQGYRTGFVGKFLNGTSDVLGARAAPGWDHWYAILGDPGYYGIEVSDDGRRRHLTNSTYTTTRFSSQAVKFIRRAQGARPFFLWLAQYAPHARRSSKDGYCHGGTPVPLPHDARRFRDAKFDKRPNFNEENVRDKPRSIRKLPRLHEPEKRQVRRNYRCTLAALQEVDRGVGDVVHALDRAGELRDTVIVFTSDNGAFFGEHRLLKHKGRIYEEALRVPLAIRAPNSVLGARGVAEADEPVAQIDLAPTLLDLANADPCTRTGKCRRMDGRRLTGLLTGSQAGWPNDRGILVERVSSAFASRRAHEPNCGFLAIRTADEMLNVDRRKDPGGGCQDGKSEFYDMSSDPYQLRNRSDDPDEAGRIASLRGRIGELRECTGIAGREAPVPGRPFCE